MKKLFHFTFITGIVCLVLAGPLFGNDDNETKWAAGYKYGFFEVEDADYKTEGNYHSVNLRYTVTDNFALELESGYVELKTKSGSELGVLPLYLNSYLSSQVGRFSPYVVGGIGAMYFDTKTLKGDDREDKKFGVSWKAGLGVEYPLGDRLLANVDVTYMYGNTGGGATLDVYGWIYSAGFRFLF